uniref:Putative kunitz n=1 Tax=Ixodes ricinus TaxID=34613 RepID=A0A6B0U8M7_IXORI
MRMVFLVFFLILACSVVGSQARVMRMPSRCVRGREKLCKTHYKPQRFFFDFTKRDCSEFYGCWRKKNGFSTKWDCLKECKVGIAG